MYGIINNLKSSIMNIFSTVTYEYTNMSTRILKGPKFRHPIEEKSLGHFFFNRCTKYHRKISQIDAFEDKCETYDEIKFKSVRVALELRKRKISPGDVISVCSANNLDCVIPIMATLFLGAKISNFDPSFSAFYLSNLISLVTPKIIFVDEDSVDLIEKALQIEKNKSEIVVFGNSDKLGIFEDFTKPKENEDTFLPVDVNVDDGAVIFFSSGTTGLPKAVCHSHRSYFAMIGQACQSGWDNRVLYFTTVYSVTGMMILFGCFNLGGCRIFSRDYTPGKIFQIVEKYKVKSVYAVPFLTYQLTQSGNIRKCNTSSVKIVLTGGATIAPPQLDQLMQLFPQATVNMIYGMTEVGTIAAFDPEVDHQLAKRKPTSSGKPSPELTLKVVDPDTGKTLGDHQKGEICVTSPSLMKGYLKTGSSEIFTVFDRDGFLKTGDIGYFDEDDCLYVIERTKNVFKCQGWNVIPFGIEQILLQHPAVKEVVVFGVPHTQDGQVPAACIVLKENCAMEEFEIDFLNGKVADVERLRGGVIFVDAMPKTPTGKIARKQIRDFAISKINDNKLDKSHYCGKKYDLLQMIRL